MAKTLTLALTLIIILGIAACGVVKSDTQATNLIPEADVVKTDTVNAGEIRMDYCSFGSGSKVFVILPGLSVKPVTPSAEAISQAFADFTQEYTVYLFDRRSNAPDGYSIYDMAGDTAAVMKTLGIEKADIFGASQGGMIAQCIALEHPGLVNKLVLGSTISRANERIAAGIEEWVQLAEKKDGYALNEAFCRAIYSEATMQAYGDILLAAGNDFTDEELERFVVMASSIKNFDVYDRLSELKCEVLVLGCEGDKVTTAEGAMEIAEKLGCEYYIYGSEYGHAVFDEAPDYRPRILQFLTGQDKADQSGK